MFKNRTALFSFLAVYILWGSTYLAIRYAIETIPAVSLTASRFIIATIFMGLISWFKKEKPLLPKERKIAILSGMLLIAANAIVCVVEYWVPSGIAAVIVGAMPIWMMFLGWFFFGHGRPKAERILGALIGLAGVALIAGIGGGETISTADASPFSRYGILLLCISGILWSTGGLMQRQVPGVKSLFRFTTVQMGAGAVIATLGSLCFEKPWEHFSTVSSTSFWAMVYLVVFGSIIGFTAFSWLSRNVEPHLVSTYALVNPVIAVGLGWIFFREPITPTFIGATVLVLVGLSLLMGFAPLSYFKKKD